MQAENIAVLSVSELNKKARILLEHSFTGIWVEGEISNLSTPASGHIYLSLKDSNSQIRCAFFKGANSSLKFKLRDGMQVKVCGNVSIYERGGDYQLIITRLEALGEGELKLKFEQLKRKLQQEGLFNYEVKKNLPKFVQTVGIVSSPTGAVIRDIISVFKRRAQQVELVLVPTAVQGEGATLQIVNAIKLADDQNFDALIIGRGGGSLEDLWCFNEEAVARAIFACKTPTVSAVGHEIDVSISDFVADVRAPTPSAAAEILAPDVANLVRQVGNLKQQLINNINNTFKQQKLRLQGLRVPHPSEKLQQNAQMLDMLQAKLIQAAKNNIYTNKHRFYGVVSKLRLDSFAYYLQVQTEKITNYQTKLRAVLEQKIKINSSQLQIYEARLQIANPLATLNRGFSVLQTQGGKIITSASQTKIGQSLVAKLKDGKISVRVERNGLKPVNLSLFD